jgi:hypothetical protein
MFLSILLRWFSVCKDYCPPIAGPPSAVTIEICGAAKWMTGSGLTRQARKRRKVLSSSIDDFDR